MQRFLIAAFMAVLSSTMVFAEEFSGAVTSGIDSQYKVKPGFVAHHKPIWWNNIHLEYDGWYVNLWGSLGMEKKRETFGDELDFTIGKKFFVVGCDIDLSSSYFVISEFGDGTNDLYIFDGRVDFPNKIPWVTPWVATRYFGRIGEKSARGSGGWFFWVGVQRAQPLGFHLPFQKDIFTLNFDGGTAFSTGGAFHGEAGPVYTQIKASTKLTVSDSIFIKPWVTWQIPIQEEGHYVDGKQHIVYGVLVTHTF